VACWMHVAGAAHTGAPDAQGKVKPLEALA
jgi:hypothetical protein